MDGRPPASAGARRDRRGGGRKADCGRQEPAADRRDGRAGRVRARRSDRVRRSGRARGGARSHQLQQRGDEADPPQTERRDRDGARLHAGAGADSPRQPRAGVTVLRRARLLTPDGPKRQKSPRYAGFSLRRPS
ncbi:hypothetical protein BLAT2472_90037 [Burkholderia latens]